VAADPAGTVKMVSMKLESLKESKPHEYAIRFVFGGACTVLAGLIAKRFGPGMGGLFLAFPAIFPAGASLIESHEKRRKREVGLDGTRRGQVAAGVDAAGAALGAIGLVGFAAVVWLSLERHSAVWVIAGATAVWLLVSVGLWMLRRMGMFRGGRKPVRTAAGAANKG
jgi:hypothetical protein